MSGDEKIVRKMRRGNRNIKFSELDGVLRRRGVEVKQPRKGGSHYTYKRGEGTQKIRLTIVKPHGKEKTVHPAAVEEVLEKLGLDVEGDTKE